MKKLSFYLFTAIAGCVFLFTSCEKEVIKEVEKKIVAEVQRISFESVELDNSGFQNDFPDGLLLSDVDFYNHYEEASWEGYTYTVWEGFAVSKNTDQLTPGYSNEFSVYASSGANGSEKFAVAYSGEFYQATNCQFIGNQEFNFKSLMINNTTLTVFALKDGLGMSRAFGANDWFKIIITGFNANGDQTGKVEFYLADFRNGKSYICQEWTEVNLRNLGKANKLEFTFESTDNNQYGILTPAYACIDDIIYYVK